MNIFHAVSVYQLLNVILYKRKYCVEQENCLILRELMLPKILNIKLLENEFNKIILYDDMWKAKTIATQEKNIVAYFDDLFNREQLSLENELLIVGCAHNTFGMYLSIKSINFVFLEDAAGLLSRPYILDDVNARQNNLKYRLIHKYELITGSNPCITGYVCDFLAQDVSFDEEKRMKSTDLCVVKELSLLSENERNELMSIFIDTTKRTLKSDALILLTQHFASLRTMSFEEQMSIYQIFIDYYLEGYNIIFKPHPDDVMFYPMLFTDVLVIREKFPAEFLPFIFDEKPSAIATISSTSSFSLRSSFDDVIEMGTSFEKDFIFTHRYFVAVELIKKISTCKKIATYGCNEIMLKQLLRDNVEGCCLQENIANDTMGEIAIIDKTEGVFEDTTRYILENIDKTSFIIMNTDNSYHFYNGLNKEVWNYLIPIVITKKKNCFNGDIHALDLEDEIIYFATQEERIKSMLKEIRINKSLEHCGMDISTVTLTEEQEKIKILEGMLEATEKRMLYHMKQNTEEKN